MNTRLKIYIVSLLITIGIPLSAIAKQPLGVISSVPTYEKVIALTFDADMTPQMLKKLEQKKVKSWYNAAVIKDLEDANVPATLFLTGMWIKTYPNITKALSRNPLFEIGNHSYSHGGFTPNCYHLNTIPESHDINEIQETETLLLKYAARHTNFFRFPGLCYDRDDILAVENAGDVVIAGDVYGGDGFQKNSKKILENVVSKVRPGSIIVLHMHGGPNAPKTAVALPRIIKTLRAEGYAFKKVSDLLSYSNKL